MVDIVLLCSLGILTLLVSWLAGRVWRLSRSVLRATKRAPAPEKWESKLRELEADVASLSSSFEKVTRLLMRLNSRAGMRELRSDPAAAEAPPIGTNKAELRRHYGLNVPHQEFARRQLSLVPDQKE